MVTGIPNGVGDLKRGSFLNKEYTYDSNFEFSEGKLAVIQKILA